MLIKDVIDNGCIECGHKEFTPISKGLWGVSCNHCNHEYYWIEKDGLYYLVREHLYKVNEDTGDASKWNLEVKTYER